MRILLIEDDAMVGKGLSRTLSDAGMTVDWVRDGVSGDEALAVGGHALTLLDLGLGGMDGIRVLDAARKRGDRTPILVITARDDLETRIEGLDLGADDFLVKPFEPRELLARMRAVLRRHAGQATSVIAAGEIDVDMETHEVSYRGSSAVLPAREFALLRALVERPGRILSRSQLEERLYGWGEEVESNAIDVLIHYIRRKFDRDIIRNIRGAGWVVPKGT
jgi:two-component system, OmpR family, response regulator